MGSETLRVNELILRLQLASPDKSPSPIEFGAYQQNISMYVGIVPVLIFMGGVYGSKTALGQNS